MNEGLSIGVNMCLEEETRNEEITMIKRENIHILHPSSWLISHQPFHFHGIQTREPTHDHLFLFLHPHQHQHPTQSVLIHDKQLESLPDEDY